MAIHTRTRKTDGITMYSIDFRDQDGVRVRETAGTTRTQAKNLLTKRLGEVRAGTYLNPANVVVTTFREASKSFLEEHKTKTNYTSHALKAALDHFGDRQLAEIRAGDFDSFRRALHDRKLGASTIRKYMTAAGTLFEWARRKGYVAVNPSADVEKPVEPTHKVRFLTREEWNRADAAAPPWLQPMMRFAIASGARLQEVVGLRWDDVDDANGMIHFGEDNKTGKPRTVPLNRALRFVLKGQIRHVRSPYVFLDVTGNPYRGTQSQNRISKRTTALMKSAGVPGAGFHTLRHTAASWMVQAGTPLAMIQAILGHSSTQTTLKYAHLMPEHLSDSMAALDAAMQFDTGDVDTQVDTKPALKSIAANEAPEIHPVQAVSASGRGAAW